MYPNLYYFFRDIFGWKIGALRFVNSFGFFVAISFLLAAAFLSYELKRKSSQGLLKPTETKIMVGKPAALLDLALNFFLGFILGYKIIALFFLSAEATQDPQAFIFSGNGNWLAGIITGLLFAGLKWYDLNKIKLPKPEERIVRIWPQDRVGEFTMIALVAGLIGARLFDIFENWRDFMKDPAARIFSGGGLTFYGGLICAAFAIAIYCRRHKIGVRYFADAIAPSLMIAYAVGRIGCQVSGDGDWGIYNTAYKVNGANHVALAQPQDFEAAVAANADYFARNPNQHHATFKKPGALSFLPDGFFAYQFPHNVNEVGVPISGCSERYCTQLPVPVFPTSFYEFIAGTLLFGLLWALRKKLRLAGSLFCLYLILNGIERFFIEQIRVNTTMNLFGLQPTQAEVIATGLMLLGAAGWLALWIKYKNIPQKL